METIWMDFFRESSIYAVIVGGVGLAMVLLRWMAFGYVAHVAKAAGRMGRTKNRFLKRVKNAFDKELLRHEQVDNVAVFVEREMSGLSFLGMSVSFVDRLNIQGILLVVSSCFIGMVQGYYESWDIQTMGILLTFSMMVFILLLTLENLLSLDEQEDLLSVRITDYLENWIKGDILMGERNLQKKERSLLLARQMEARMAKKEMAADKQEPEPEQADPTVFGLNGEQEEVFMEMLNEFFG